MIPAHKNINNPPGQIINRDYLQGASKEASGQIVNKELTISDYIERKTWNDVSHEIVTEHNTRKKLTFDEWWASPAGEEISPWNFKADYEVAKFIWNAAQENK